jgi:hypothetical protein
MTTYPAALRLPEGVAVLVIGSAVEGCPRYERDGVPIEVDVRIPEDLRGRWIWKGSFLCWEGTSPGLWLDTATLGLPGIFDAARAIEASRRAPAEPTQMVMWA